MRRPSLPLGLSLPSAFALALLACPQPPVPAPKPKPTAPSPSDGASQPTADASPTTTKNEVSGELGPDPHSFAHTQAVKVTHMGLALDVAFDEKRLTGHAVLLVERIDPDAPLRLDTRDLEIMAAATANADVKPGRRHVPELLAREPSLGFAPTTFGIGASDPILGAPLEIALPPAANLVRIEYRTRPGATGLQWLEPGQTAGGKQPFLYSQSQAIHARSWVPCQDTPGNRFTFDASIRAPQGARAVMAAEMLDVDPADATLHRFLMPQAIPSYLLALGVGDLAFRELGPRSGVYADPSMLESAAHEFAEVESMITTAETLYGPYRWGRYDILVLPPAFPFGGMENPRLTFATPTIIAGDRSLMALVAHELAHSWSGNLVTNSTWADMWLNEGFTTYAERRIIEAVYGKERAEMESTLGRQDLDRDLTGSLADKPDDQRLSVDLKGRDPDDNMTGIPYEKGALFLRTLEDTYGREAFDPFLAAWFDKHAFGTVTTDDFTAFLREKLTDVHKPRPGKAVPDAATWISGSGVPKGAADPSSNAFARIDDIVKAWVIRKTDTAELPTKDWTPHEWLHFLRALPHDLGSGRMAELDARFALTKSGNSEILDEWLVLAARHDYQAAYERMESFLLEVGRRKFVLPVFRELARTEPGMARAKAIYAKARPRYHAITRQTLDELLGVPAGG